MIDCDMASLGPEIDPSLLDQRLRKADVGKVSEGWAADLASLIKGYD